MGATVHAHIEYQTTDGRWVHYAAPRIERNYKLFSLIAGIRNDSNGIQPIVRPKGLPTDISEVTQICYDLDAKGAKLQGKTWLNRDEFARLQERWNELNPDKSVTENDFEWTVFRVMAPASSAIVSCHGFQDVRVIFWFDD